MLQGCLFFFVFQAEDGIRDYKVTGVQTCALPISSEQQLLSFSSLPGGFAHPPRLSHGTDRKSVVEGKSVDLGGRRIIKKKKKNDKVGVVCAHSRHPRLAPSLGRVRAGGDVIAGEPCREIACEGTYYCFRLFFFQAEDGIRDYKVTGVQTCALPICIWFRESPTPAPGGCESSRNQM